MKPASQPSREVDFLPILASHEGPNVFRRDSHPAVWDLRRPWALARRQRREAFDACRGELLAALLGTAEPVYLLNPESPADWDVPGDWKRVGRSTWRVPPGFDPHESATRGWLFRLGDWCFYRAAAPVEAGWPDVFRSSAGSLVAWMRQRAVRALLASFHDDAEWVVAVS